jgi:hypothetical protein
VRPAGPPLAQGSTGPIPHDQGYLADRLFRTVEAHPSPGRSRTCGRLLLLEASSAMSEQVEALQGFDKHDQSRAAVMAG